MGFWIWSKLPNLEREQLFAVAIGKFVGIEQADFVCKHCYTAALIIIFICQVLLEIVGGVHYMCVEFV